ncbi:probable serine/threonine-protein kinase DDB_G0284251 isoform X2 [Acropora muricata]|uniref:probable serine/threonine-protein kinase DDB_G0284251 isoform X2 n=1 Tax=Acropora muricata TaxID=159855 RepID=UPI0034E4B9FA
MCGHVKEEITALTLAKKGNVKEIVGYFGAKVERGIAHICMEYMEGGTLRKYVEDGGPVSEKTCAAFGKDLLLAVKFVHEEAGIVHRDIHASNILLDEHRTYVKLADFGLAQAIQEDTPFRRSFDDNWKIGCVLLFMLNGEISPLFDERDPDERERMEAVNPEQHFPTSASREMLELLNLIFGVGREQLPSAAEILRVATIFNRHA